MVNKVILWMKGYFDMWLLLSNLWVTLLFKCLYIFESNLLPCLALYGNIVWTFCVPSLFIIAVFDLFLRWSSWFTSLHTVLIGYLLTSIVTAFRCCIFRCKCLDKTSTEDYADEVGRRLEKRIINNNKHGKIAYIKTLLW